MRLTPPAGLKVRYRLDLVKGSLLLIGALTIDVIQFILALTGVGAIVSVILGIIADAIIPAAAFMMGVRFGGRQGAPKLLVLLAGTVTELVPFLDIVPGYTIEVLILILLTRSEDIEEAIKKDKKERAARIAAQRRRDAMQQRFRISQMQAQQAAEQEEASTA